MGRGLYLTPVSTCKTGVWALIENIKEQSYSLVWAIVALMELCLSEESCVGQKFKNMLVGALPNQ